jgi:hypothetical protein
VYWFRGLGKGEFAAREVLLDDTKSGQYSMATTNSADLDGDGDQDLVIGDASGAVFWARNEGTRSAPKFERREPLRVGSRPLRVCHKSDPIAVDWDGDGLLDLLVGDEATDVSFFAGRTDGTYEPGVSLFSRLPVDLEDDFSSAEKRLAPHRVIPGYRLRLATADWNGDGKLDLLVGNCETKPLPEGKKRSETIGHVYVLLRE